LKEELSILVVDDESGMRETLRDIFRLPGYTVDLASTGEEALAKAREKFYNVVILDIRLPDLDGVEVLKGIKESSPDTEVVIITAYASLQSSVDALNLGAHAYIMKPFDVGAVRKTVADAVEKQRLIRENRELRAFNEDIIQSLNEGVVVEDAEGRISFINPKVEELLQLPGKEILGKPLRSFVAPGYEKLLESRASPRGERIELMLVSSDRSMVPVMVSTVELRSGKGIISVLTDISKIKELEKELKEKIEELEHFNKLMVGRELRMVELKDRIKELEAELEKLREA